MSHASSPSSMVSHWGDSARALASEVSATLRNMFSSPSKGAQFGASLMSAVGGSALLLADPVVADERPVVEVNAAAHAHPMVLARQKAINSDTLVMFVSTSGGMQKHQPLIEEKFKSLFKNKYDIDLDVYFDHRPDAKGIYIEYYSKSRVFGEYRRIADAKVAAEEVAHEHALVTVKVEYPQLNPVAY